MEIQKNDQKDDQKKPRNVSEGFERHLPPIHGMRKSLNYSPKRKIISLKLPKVELNPRDTYFMGFKTPTDKSEHPRYLSMSVDYVSKSALPERGHQSPVKSNLKHYLLQVEDFQKNSKQKMPLEQKPKASSRVKMQKNSNLIRKYWKNSAPAHMGPDISIKGEGAVSKVCLPHLAPGENSLYTTTKLFCESIEEKYLTAFEEIDLNRNGYIALDDIINYLILKGLMNPEDKGTSYLSIKNTAQEIFQVFVMVSGKYRVHKKDFFAVFSVFEQFKGQGVEGEVLSVNNFRVIRQRILELKGVFECYAKGGVIDQRELKSILACVYIDDIHMIGNMLFSEAINFSRFLRHIPVFLWMHHEVVKQLDIVNK